MHDFLTLPAARVGPLRLLATVALLSVAPPALSQEAAADQTRAVRVTIEGIDGALRDNVRALLSIVELERGGIVARLDPRETEEAVSVTELERRHRMAPGEIRDALMPFGYYLPEIDAELIDHDERFEARYRIDPGPPTRLRDVTIRAEGEGAELEAIEAAVAEAALASGDRLDHRRYEAARERIFDAAYDRGFLRARWREREIRVLPNRTEADIRLVLDTGPRFHFGEVTVEAERLDPDFTARFVEIEPGEPYDVRRLLHLQRVLNDSEYFSYVEIDADVEAADERNRIPVTVSTEPVRPQRYTVGAGFATDTGPRFNLGVRLRRVNARGHRFRSDLQLSQIESAVTVRYEIPIRNVASDRLDFALTARQIEIGDADSRQFTGTVGQSVSWRGFRRRFYGQLQSEEFEFTDAPSQTTNLLYPGVTLSRERGDDPMFPRRGYGVEMDLRGSSSEVFSDVSFLRLRASARWVYPLAANARLLLRGEAGTLVTDRFDALPPSQRFFAGGDRSVRGYEFQGLGERNAEGDVIGGEQLLVGSVEVDHLFYGDFGAAAFVDAGDAFNGAFDPKVGTGAGLRWRSPVGMLRFDVAHPFDDDDAYRIHLSIGADL